MLLVAVALLGVFFTTRPAHAYAWMIRHGYSGCPVCHADPSGGETLTAYGRAQSDLLLRTRWDGKSPEEAEPGKASNFLWFLETPPSLLLGGSVRLATTYTDKISVFPMQLDTYGQLRVGKVLVGGGLGVIKVPASSPYGRTAQVTTAQGEAYNLISRTHYVGYDFDGQYTLRAGRLNLPFGVRIPEHIMWVRQATRTDRESGGQHGVSLAYNAETLRGELMAILGNYQINPDMYRERGYSAFLEVMAGSRAAFGVSSFYTYAKRDRVTLESNIARGAHGVFTRLALADPLALLAEADIMTDSTRSLGFVGFVQADYEVVQGLHGLVTFEWLDQGYAKSAQMQNTPRTKGAGQMEVAPWFSADWFFMPHMDVRADFIVRPDNFEILGQFHAFL
ncbi:MAG TPA: hypothetical protein VFV94_13595 [Polyangiaceae bacterium]|nr:hypothetical protein [Polyangiaceae bacterium]